MEIVKVFITGIVTIGILTALFAPGRQTVAGFNAITSGGAKLLDTAEKG